MTPRRATASDPEFRLASPSLSVSSNPRLKLSARVD